MLFLDMSKCQFLLDRGLTTDERNKSPQVFLTELIVVTYRSMAGSLASISPELDSQKPCNWCALPSLHSSK